MGQSTQIHKKRVCLIQSRIKLYIGDLSDSVLLFLQRTILYLEQTHSGKCFVHNVYLNKLLINHKFETTPFHNINIMKSLYSFMNTPDQDKQRNKIDLYGDCITERSPNIDDGTQQLIKDEVHEKYFKFYSFLRSKARRVKCIVE